MLELYSRPSPYLQHTGHMQNYSQQNISPDHTLTMLLKSPGPTTNTHRDCHDWSVLSAGVCCGTWALDCFHSAGLCGRDMCMLGYLYNLKRKPCSVTNTHFHWCIDILGLGPPIGSCATASSRFLGSLFGDDSNALISEMAAIVIASVGRAAGVNCLCERVVHKPTVNDQHETCVLHRTNTAGS